jgi:hypothetical protein
MNAETQRDNVPVQKQCPECGAALPAGALAGLCPACLLKQGAAVESGARPSPASFAPMSVAAVARLFPQLEILALLGAGGMGAVYKARQPALDRLVALKLLPATNAAGVNFAERFNREARALARLSHPNIVTVHEFGQVADPGASPGAGALHFFIMEYVDGANLRQLEQAGRLSPREALQIIPQICDALQYAHDEGVVHRDIKPENVLVDRKGRVKIADFGLAKILGHDPEAARLTAEGQVMGTPHYMAPEQVERPLQVDHRADIYSLGVVLYEMLTGDLPLGKFPPPSRKVQVDVRLDEVVLRALENDPARRYQHASQVKTDLATITATGEAAAPAAEAMSDRPPAPPPVAPPPAVIRTAKKMKGEFLGIGAAVQAIGLACFFLPHVGFILGIVLLLIGGRMALKWVCTRCGHHTTKHALICLACGAQFENPAGRTRGTPSPGIEDERTLCWAGFPLVSERDGVRSVNWNQTLRAWAILLGLLTIAFGFVSAFTGRSLLGWIGIIGWPSLVVRVFIAALLVAWGLGRAKRRSLAEDPPRTAQGTVILAPASPSWLRERFVLPVVLLIAVAWTLMQQPLSDLTSGVLSRGEGPSLGVAAVAQRDPASGSLVAPLPGGAAVELVALADADATPQAWWRPDGSPVTNATLEAKTFDLPFVPKTQRRHVIVQLRDMPQGAGGPTIECFPAARMTTGGRVLRDGQPLPLSWPVLAAFPASARKAAMQVGVGLDSWRTIATQQAQGQHAFQKRQPEDPLWEVDFSREPAESRGEAQISYIFGEIPRTWTHRIVAVDTNGLEHSPSRASASPVEKRMLYTVAFRELPLSAVQEFRLQVRPVHWVKFRDIALRPRGPLPEPRLAPSGPVEGEVTSSEAADAAAVRQVAENFLAAIRGSDDAALQSLAYDSVPGWGKALPHFAGEIRHTLQARGVKGEALTEIADVRSKADWAAVKVPGPKEAGGMYLVLLFTRTGEGWRNGLLKNSAAHVPLEKHLDDYVTSLAGHKPAP